MRVWGCRVLGRVYEGYMAGDRVPDLMARIKGPHVYLPQEALFLGRREKRPRGLTGCFRGWGERYIS